MNPKILSTQKCTHSFLYSLDSLDPSIFDGSHLNPKNGENPTGHPLKIPRKTCENTPQIILKPRSNPYIAYTL